jgi:hypothetical protein
VRLLGSNRGGVQAATQPSCDVVTLLLKHLPRRLHQVGPTFGSQALKSLSRVAAGVASRRSRFTRPPFSLLVLVELWLLSSCILFYFITLSCTRIRPLGYPANIAHGPPAPVGGRVLELFSGRSLDRVNRLFDSDWIGLV